MNSPNIGLKFCGLTVLTDIVASLKLKIDYIGFNFWPGSKRFISPAQARTLWLKSLKIHKEENSGHAHSTKAIGLLVNPQLSEIMGLLRDFPEIEGIQLHGQESPKWLASIQTVLRPRTIWKALPILKKEDFEAISSWIGHVDLILLDALVRQDGDSGYASGGLGVTFDWSLIQEARALELLSKVPWGLAGGVHALNMKQAIELKPALIDICSGIELKPGIKDEKKMQTIVRLCHERTD